MSTDGEDEGGGGSVQAASGSSHGLHPVPVLLVTANVGSVFEDPLRLVPTWQGQMLDHLAGSGAQFVAIHFQEVGHGASRRDGIVRLSRDEGGRLYYTVV